MRMGLGAGEEFVSSSTLLLNETSAQPDGYRCRPEFQKSLAPFGRDAPGGSGSVLRRQVVDALREHLLQAAELASQLEATVGDGQEAAGQDQVNH